MKTEQKHPSPEQLAAFGLGRLQGAEREGIERHVADCDSCCAALGALPVDSLLGLARQAARAQPLSCGPALGETQAVGGTTPAEGYTAPGTAELPPELAEHPRYRIISLLGQGGMGAVYKAEHRIMERQVALKVINPAFLAGNPTAVERFRLEVKAAGKLSHPNVVAAHDADQAGDLHFLVMEFVDGISLGRLVDKKGPLSVAHACHFVRQAALGLQHAHERGMVHRDIKPSNLMVTRKGQVKVLDFGLARFASERAVSTAEPVGLPMPSDDSGTAPLTAPGLVLGTPDFIAPEQARNPSTADIRADIYSLGCTLYFLLTGKPPFAEGSAFDKLLSHLQELPRPLTELRGDLPADLAAAVAKMMAKDPAERYQTPADVAKALAPFTRAEGVAVLTEAAPPAPEPVTLTAKVKPPAKRKHPRLLLGSPGRIALLVGVGLLVLAGSGLGVWVGWKAWMKPSRILVVMPAKDFWYPDYEPVERVLTRGGCKLTIASTTQGTAQGIGGDKNARRTVPIDAVLENVNVADYDGVVLLGGADMNEFKPHEAALKDLLLKIRAGPKPVAAVCRGIMLLLGPGVPRGQRIAKSEQLAPWPMQSVTWVDEPVVVDGKVITAKNAEAAADCAQQLLVLLRKTR
jgi:eukaryotic-like serine/threonine-protein kinase